MRTVLVVSVIAMLGPVMAMAQGPPAAAAPNAAPARGGDITRDDYIQRAVERARRAAEKRFDQMDANHDGVLTAGERRDYRAQRRQQRDSQSQ